MPRTAKQLTRDGVFEQWIAGHLVALMGPQMPVTAIRDWSARKLLDNFEQSNPGKNNPRKYSFVNAVQLHGMYQARRGGTDLEKAALVGRACVERFLERFDAGDRRFDEPWLRMAYRFDHQGKLYKSFWTDEQVAQEFLGTVRSYLGPLICVFDVDTMLERLWRNYQTFDEGMNNLALAGKLKPFPKYLR